MIRNRTEETKGGKRATASRPRDLISLVGKIHAVLVAFEAATGIAPDLSIVSRLERSPMITRGLRVPSVCGATATHSASAVALSWSMWVS